MEIFSRYHRPKSVGLKCPEPSLTQQIYAQQCDINFLIKQYHLESNPYDLSTYVMPGKSVEFRYMDASSVPDIYSSIIHYKQIAQVFSSLSYAEQAKYSFSVDAFASALLKMDADELKKVGLPNLYIKVPAENPETPSSVSDDGSKPESQSMTPENSNNKASA